MRIVLWAVLLTGSLVTIHQGPASQPSGQNQRSRWRQARTHNDRSHRNCLEACWRNAQPGQKSATPIPGSPVAAVEPPRAPLPALRPLAAAIPRGALPPASRKPALAGSRAPPALAA